MPRGDPPAAPAASRSLAETGRLAATSNFLVIVPAHNEAPGLGQVIADLRRFKQGVPILVVDDGSTDGTTDLVEELGVLRLTLPCRLGVGGAMRAGLKYARALGYETVVRVDGDGQHSASEIPRLLEPVLCRRADAAIGSRYLGRRGDPTPALRRWTHRILARCLSVLAGRRITDPTSGFAVFGPAAVRLLGLHHPTGYPEPELLLFLARSELRVVEVPIRMLRRQAGRTSLTPGRAGLAGARTLLAFIVVPLRAAVEGLRRD
jgi:glycosyltransferase involved in cell wall biosynthesis